jgi:uncharacterized UPF0160 family protein
MNSIIKTVVVHNSVFHADDVICVSLLRLYYGKENVTVVRSRNPKDFETADYILDVGGRREVTDNQVWFDHHQDVTTYDNGVRRSACGYLFEYLMQGDLLPLRLAESFRSKVLYPVEAQDNGQDTIEGFDLMPNLFNFISCMNPNWNSDSNGDKEFLVAVEMTDRIIENVIGRLISASEADYITMRAIYDSDSSIIELEQYCPWYNVVFDWNKKNLSTRKILFVIWKGRDGSYMAQAVAKSANTRETWISYPESMRGKRADEIDSIADTDSAVFVHPTGFLGAWKNKEDLYKVLNNIIGCKI